MTMVTEVPVHPSVLRWARETSATTIEDAARRIDVSPSTYSRLEKSDSTLSIGDLRKLAAHFKRPLAVFLLNKPPHESQLPTDFRVLPGHSHSFARETRLAIRKAGRLRDAAAELLRELSHDSPSNGARARLSDNVRDIAIRERGSLGIPVSTQVAWKDENNAFREWRNAIERANVLIFQFQMPIEDARGFSLGNGGPPVIALSSSDVVHARIFTLFHEYGHLLLRAPGVCNPKAQPSGRRSQVPIEQWCNQFAAEFLVPKNSMLGWLEQEFPSGFDTQIADASRSISRAFKVSEHVALWRLYSADLIRKSAFSELMTKLQRVRRAKKKGGGPQFSASRKCFSENGRQFTSLVLEARSRNLINYADVADYLSLKLKYLPEVQGALLSVAG